MNRILLFGAGKSATCLIDYLIRESVTHDWDIVVADGNLQAAQSKVGKSDHARALAVDVENPEQRRSLIGKADLVISLLPPSLHILVARDCLALRKNLLTASYVDEAIRALAPEIERNGLLFLCEMGLDPGIDHMSAMELIHRIRDRQGKIHSFKSHTGGLVAPESDDNPWHYKISWNPRNIVLAGKAGAIYKENGSIRELTYEKLFDDCPLVKIDGLGNLAYYPNRDSLSYIPVYSLQEASTFIRTTLRYPDFCSNWKWVVKSGLTDDRKPVDPKKLNFRAWSAPIQAFLTEKNRPFFQWLGFFDEEPVPPQASTSADILQYVLETRLAMKPGDRDMIVMLHEFEYEIAGSPHSLKSSLIVKGENNIRTAMAKTVGLPLGIAAKLILQRRIMLTGLHIPILPAIYEPVLEELKVEGISFTDQLS